MFLNGRASQGLSRCLAPSSKFKIINFILFVFVLRTGDERVLTANHRVAADGAQDPGPGHDHEPPRPAARQVRQLSRHPAQLPPGWAQLRGAQLRRRLLHAGGAVRLRG